MNAAPRWLLALLFGALALVAVLLWAETQRLRPYYSVGDETFQVQSLVAIRAGAPLQWRWVQGDLQRNALYGWWRLTGSGPGRLLDLGLLVFAAELVLLALVATRWAGPTVAAWALLADLLCADTWMRVRSILSFQWLPAQILLLAWLAGKVRSRWAALLWSVAAACLVLDYEGALLALPGLIAVCLAQETAFRRRWAWVLGGFVLALLAILRLQPRSLADYSAVRHAASVGTAPAALLLAWGRNLWQLLVGGKPLAYFSVERWPAFTLWALPLLFIGVVLAWRARRWTWLAWAAGATLASQASLGHHGVPAHRLVVAWPILCLLAGLGGAWLQARLGGSAARWLLPLVLLGGAAEADAFFRHMAIHGERQWGRSRNMAEAGRWVASAPPGVAVDSALLEARYPDLRFHVQPRRGDGTRAWVLLAPGDRVLAGALGRTLAVHDGMNDEPVPMLQASGAVAARFDAMEADLRTLLPLPLDPAAAQAREQAWLRRGGHDDWALWAVLELDMHHYFDGRGMDPLALALFKRHPPLTPAPWVVLGRVAAAAPDSTDLRAFDHALQLDPLYLPALLWKARALEAMGRLAEARALRELAQRRQAQGAWLIGE